MDYYVPPRPWYRPRVRTLFYWALVLVIASTIYSYWSDSRDAAVRRRRELLTPPIGAVCSVVFNREAIGVKLASLRPGTINGVENSVSGRFVMLNDQWIVLDGLAEGSSQRWIPRESVLLIEVDSQ